MGFNEQQPHRSAQNPMAPQCTTPILCWAGTMNKVGQKVRSRWRSLARWVQWTLLTLIVLAVALRLSLPFIVRDYVNRQLNRIPDYHGHVEKVRMHLYRGAYSVLNLEVVKTNG